MGISMVMQTVVLSLVKAAWCSVPMHNNIIMTFKESNLLLVIMSLVNCNDIIWCNAIVGYDFWLEVSH